MVPKKSYSHIFIDESGEFGVAPESTDYLIIVALKTNDPRSIEKIARKVWSGMQLNKRTAQEIHAADADERTVVKILQLVNTKDIEIDAYIYKKQKDQPISFHAKYYEILQVIIMANTNAFHITIDKRDTNKKRFAMVRELSHGHVFDRVAFEDSRKIKQLQIVDVLAWSVFQHWEFGIDQYIAELDAGKITVHEVS